MWWSFSSGRIVTSLFFTCIVELLNQAFSFRLPTARHLNSFPTVEMCRFAYSFMAVWPLFHVLPERLGVLCRELTGNLLGMDEQFPPSTVEILVCKGFTVATQHFTASLKTVVARYLYCCAEISHSRCNTLLWYIWLHFLFPCAAADL